MELAEILSKTLEKMKDRFDRHSEKHAKHTAEYDAKLKQEEPFSRNDVLQSASVEKEVPQHTQEQTNCNMTTTTATQFTNTSDTIHAINTANTTLHQAQLAISALKEENEKLRELVTQSLSTIAESQRRLAELQAVEKSQREEIKRRQVKEYIDQVCKRRLFGACKEKALEFLLHAKDEEDIARFKSFLESLPELFTEPKINSGESNEEILQNSDAEKTIARLIEKYKMIVGEKAVKP